MSSWKFYKIFRTILSYSCVVKYNMQSSSYSFFSFLGVSDIFMGNNGTKFWNIKLNIAFDIPVHYIEILEF